MSETLQNEIGEKNEGRVEKLLMIVIMALGLLVAAYFLAGSLLSHRHMNLPAVSSETRAGETFAVSGSSSSTSLLTDNGAARRRTKLVTAKTFQTDRTERARKLRMSVQPVVSHEAVND